MEKSRYSFLRKATNCEMVSDYRGPYRHPSTHIMSSSRIGCFSQRLPDDRYIGQELGIMQHQHLEGDQHGLSSHPHPRSSSAQSHDLHEAIHREIEKERIRQEIIMSEILRRRALEAEVRRELMVERELSLQGGSNRFHYGSPSPMGLDFPMRSPPVKTRDEGRFLEERMMLSLAQTNSLSNRLESRPYESLQFQSASDDVRAVRHTEVKAVLEGVKEKRKINLQAKAIENITGAKRALSGSDASESQYSNYLKKAKEEWSLCQVSASSERGLNEDLEGKKHETNDAALRAQIAWKNNSTGLNKEKVAKSIKGSGTVDPGTNDEVKFASDPLPFNKSGDSGSGTDDPPPLQENMKSDDLKKNEPVVPHKVQKNGNHGKKKYAFWCEICQIGVFNQKVMDLHKMGKKHRRQIDKRNKCREVSPSQKNEAGEETMAEDGAVKETPEQDGVAVEETPAHDGVAVSPKMLLGWCL